MNSTCTFAPTYTALRLVDSVARREHLTNRFDILDAVCNDLEKKFGGEALEDVLQQMHMGTTTQILHVIDIYLNQDLAPSNQPTVTEGAIKLVKKIVEKQGLTDRMDILEAVCDYLEARWPEPTLEQRLRQMHLETTDRVLYVIDVYLTGRQYRLLA